MTKKNKSPKNESKLDIINAVRTPLNFYVLVVLVAEGTLGTIAGLSQGIERTILIIAMTVLILVTIVVVTLLALRKPSAVGLDDPTSRVATLPTRESYMAAMIQKSAAAKKSIFLSVHTMKPSEAEGGIPALQKNLAHAIKKELDVKILMPCGPDKIAAACELNDKKIPLRALASLIDDDLRYMLVDGEISIISLSSGIEGSSSAGVVIRSKKLCKLLRRNFEDNWNDPKAMDFDNFFISEVSKLVDSFQNLTRPEIAKQLGIEVYQLDDVFSISTPKIIFLLGRPCSGKTSATIEMNKQLQQYGYDANSIKVLNDYRILFDWFRKDKKYDYFEPDPRGGFLVKKPHLVLEKCDRKLNMEIHKSMRNNQFIIVECARQKYIKTLKHFDRQILDSSILFYLDANIETCLKRNEERAKQGSDEEKGFVPIDILRKYYSKDDLHNLRKNYATQLFQIDNKKDGIDLLQEKINTEIANNLKSWLSESHLKKNVVLKKHFS